MRKISLIIQKNKNKDYENVIDTCLKIIMSNVVKRHF